MANLPISIPRLMELSATSNRSCGENAHDGVSSELNPGRSPRLWTWLSQLCNQGLVLFQVTPKLEPSADNARRSDLGWVQSLQAGY